MPIEGYCSWLKIQGRRKMGETEWQMSLGLEG